VFIEIAKIELFVLMFIRITSALTVMPVFRHTAIPSMTKAGLGVVLALLLLPVIGQSLPMPSGTIIDFLLLGIRETLCGLLLGFAGNFLFYSVEMAGQLIGFQAGFSVVSSIDPNTEMESTVLTQVYNLIALVVFLTFDGHHMMIRAIADSFSIIPVGKLTLDGRLTEWSLAAGKQVLGDGIRMAAPLMVTLLLTDVGLGILVRVAPTLNIFIIGFPMKIAITLVMISITLGAVVSIFGVEYANMVKGFPAFMQTLSAP
jgi:flagellar biosynthesis protein FliR